MTTEFDPIAENWYRHLDKGQTFRVVDVDTEGGVVEIQYFDGDLEELDLETWYAQEIELAAPPENWSGPLDVAEPDDLGTEVTDTSDADWTAPLATIPATEPAPEEESEDDEWGEGFPQEEPLAGEV
jgi:hypothetical protein